VSLEGPLGNGAETLIRFAEPEYGVAPGQAAVLYAGERVVGGGWIAETFPAGGSAEPCPSPTPRAGPTG